MKTLLLIFTSLILLTGTNYSQSSKVYRVQEITWFGLDYSVAYFSDENAFPNPEKLKTSLFVEWNRFVFNEPEKFDIGKSFNKSNVVYSTNYINKRNKDIDIFNHIRNFRFHKRHFNNDTIQKIVSSYKMSENTSGVGLVFIVESLNKPGREAIYWVTFFDIKTKKVLLTKQIIGIPSGVGIRNYWANSFYNALIDAGYEMGLIF